MHWSPRLAVGVIIVNNWLCLFVCHTPSSCFFFICFSMESDHFWSSVLHVALYKTLFLDFWFRSLTLKIYSPKLLAITLHYHVATRGRALGSSAPAWRKSAIHWTLGPTIVAMATKFGVGTEIYTTIGLSYYIISVNIIFAAWCRGDKPPTLWHVHCRTTLYNLRTVHVVIG